jgi:hypothetical protein
MKGKEPKFRQEKRNVQTEEEYIAAAVEYALSGGWVKKEQEGILVEKYLKPIYGKYLEIIEELKKREISKEELEMIIIKMNSCLESTRRIGSTDPQNIIRTIEAWRNDAQDVDTEYALTSLLDFVSEILRS